MNEVALEKELAFKLVRIKKVFNLEDIISLNCTPEYVQKYYKVNKIPYSLFHTTAGFVHMGISRRGFYTPDDLLESIKIVEEHIRKNEAKNVLELASGRGGNSIYLAKRNTKVLFYGVDFSEEQLDFVNTKIKQLKNFQVRRGDYHSLVYFNDESFDLVFVIEALCHSENKRKIFQEVSRVLKPNGTFIVFDGYREKSEKIISKNESIAMIITEKSMALNKFEEYDLFKKEASNFFSLDAEENVSEYVLPTMNRFEWVARKFFKLPFLSKLFCKFFAEEFTYNAIAGYLMPLLVKKGLFSYRISIFKKVHR